MSEKVITLSERDVRGIAQEIVEERNREVIISFNARFDKFETDQEKREQRLTDDITRKMMPIMGDFHDKAVLKSEANTLDILTLVLQIDPKSSDERKRLQRAIDHASMGAERIANFTRTIWTHALTAIITLTFLLIIYGLAHWHSFVTSPEGKLLGVDG